MHMSRYIVQLPVSSKYTERVTLASQNVFSCYKSCTRDMEERQKQLGPMIYSTRFNREVRASQTKVMVLNLAALLPS